MIVAADHVRDAHKRIVDHDREVVRRRTVASGDDEIVQNVLYVKFNIALDAVVKFYRAAKRGFYTHYRLDPSRRRAGKVAIAVIVARALFASFLLRAQLIQLILTHIASIRLALI